MIRTALLAALLMTVASGALAASKEDRKAAACVKLNERVDSLLHAGRNGQARHYRSRLRACKALEAKRAKGVK
jgi:hypothetical protein